MTRTLRRCHNKAAHIFWRGKMQEEHDIQEEDSEEESVVEDERMKEFFDALDLEQFANHPFESLDRMVLYVDPDNGYIIPVKAEVEMETFEEIAEFSEECAIFALPSGAFVLLKGSFGTCEMCPESLDAKFADCVTNNKCTVREAAPYVMYNLIRDEGMFRFFDSWEDLVLDMNLLIRQARLDEETSQKVHERMEAFHQRIL